MTWRNHLFSTDQSFIISLFSILLLPISITISIYIYPDYPANENLSSLGARSPALSNVTKQYVEPPFPEIFNLSIMIAAVGLILTFPFLRTTILSSKENKFVIQSINATQSFGFLFLFLLGIFDLGYIRSLHDQVAIYLFYLILLTYLQMGVLLGWRRSKIYPNWYWIVLVIAYMFIISIQRQLSLWKLLEKPYYLSNGPYQKLWGLGLISLLLLELHALRSLHTSDQKPS